MNWYLAVLKNYVGFSGRARRMEYWMFMIVNFFVYAGLLAIDRMMGHTCSTTARVPCAGFTVW
jgi:uncharacterized membrane protein YhaH (DUF805 family)